MQEEMKGQKGDREGKGRGQAGMGGEKESYQNKPAGEFTSSAKTDAWISLVFEKLNKRQHQKLDPYLHLQNSAEKVMGPAFSILILNCGEKS